MGIVELVQNNMWDEAYEAFMKITDEGNLDEVSCVCGATVMEHFGYYDAMYETIVYGLKLNPQNYELYLLLGNYYAAINPDQAYLSYENAMFFAGKKGAEDDAKEIKAIMDGYVNEWNVSVRKVSFIILSYNTQEYTKLCIQSIRDTCYKGAYEIVVVDNASDDGSVEWLRQQEDVILKENSENAGFPAGCNQGIKLADPNNDIFLLNNDTLMMNNSLYLLRMGLYESRHYGATGAVTNFANNNQIAYEDGEKIEDYYKFAYENNVPCKSPYERKSMLVMYAMLIKRNVFDLVGELDERFSPGNYEDNDYGIRILEAGFQNIVCWNSFIYHYGSKSFRKDVNEYSSILKTNKQKFIEKWHFAPRYYMFTRTEVIDVMDADVDDEISVLEVGCGLGDTLAAIQYKYPKAKVQGIELEERIAKLGSKKLDIKCANIEHYQFSSEDKFDYIIFADVLEHLFDPYSLIRNMKKQLKDNGCIIASIPNLMNADVIYNLLNGDFTYKDAGILDRTHIRFFTKNEIFRMFANEGYQVERVRGSIDPNYTTDAHKAFYDKILELVGKDNKVLFDVYQYIVRARVTPET